MADSRMVTGLFRDRDSAERAYQSLSDRGYGREDVNLVMSDETRKLHFAPGTAETELNNAKSRTAGVGTTVQRFPSQRSARVLSAASENRWKLPTAHTSFADRAAIAFSEL